MTTGLIVLSNGSIVEKTLFVDSDANYSWLGVKLLEMFKSKSLKKFISSYSNEKYNEIMKKRNNLYFSGIENLKDSSNELLELSSKIEYRTHILNGANGYDCNELIKNHLNYVPKYIYIYDYKNNLLKVNDSYKEKYQINNSNIDTYLKLFEE